MNENTAPNSYKQQDVDAARMLISPPPEEELQHVFGFPRTHNSTQKRKRGGTPSKATVEVTPNPKPRKATRRIPIESPTRTAFSPNPAADYVPRSARRSVTPYEPPSDVFTPPREVLLPLSSTSKSTKSKAKPTVVRATTPLRLVVSVKKELPPINLSTPMPPPSPTDDPLLLVNSSPIRPRASRNRNRDNDNSYTHDDLPHTSDADYPPFDWTRGMDVATHEDAPTTDSMDLDAPASFDGPLPATLSFGGGGGAWDSDSDDEDELPTAALPTTNATSTVLPTTSAPNTETSTPPPGREVDIAHDTTRPTKPDPPTPNTQARAAAWGIWGSPWPGRGPFEEEGSFRMDGRRGPISTSEAAGPGAFDFSASTGLSSHAEYLAAASDGQGEEDEDDPLEEGVSILHALREEDAARRAAWAAENGGVYPSARVHGEEEMHVDAHGHEEEEDDEEDAEEEGEEEDEDAREEEEVRAMSVEAEAEPQHEHESDKEVYAPAPVRTSAVAWLNATSSPVRGRATSAADNINSQRGERPATPTRGAYAHPATPTRNMYAQQQQQHAQTPPTRRAPAVPPRGERLVGGVVERLVLPPPPPAASSGDADSGEDVQMRERQQDRESEEENAKEKEREVLSARGTRQPPASPRKSTSTSSGLEVMGFPRASPGPFPAATAGSPFLRADPARDLASKSVQDRARGEEEVDVDVGEEGEGEGGSDDESDTSGVLGLVKITSADPRAAARAAAILKQHDYDCFTRLQRPRARRHSFAGVGKSAPAPSPSSASRSKTPQPATSKMQDIRELRRKHARLSEQQKPREISKAKEQKSKEKEKEEKPRVVGDHVYFPGSPAPVTTAQLLAEAEAEVSASGRAASPSASASERDAQESVSARLPALRVSARDQDLADGEEDGQREWGKAQWKALDACFTDERIALAAKLGIVPQVGKQRSWNPFSTPQRDTPTSSGTEQDGAAVMMAPADAVEPRAVVVRFVELYGDGWDVESLTKRAEALQNKQRAGHVAPPTPRASVSSPFPPVHPLATSHTAFPPAASSTHARRPSTSSPTPMPMLTLTPLGRPRLPPRVGRGAPFSALPPTPEPARRRRVPGSLMAPRYLHLLEEAVAVSGGGSGSGRHVHEEESEEDTSFTDADKSGEGSGSVEQDSSFASSGDGDDAEMAPATPLREREALLERSAPAPAPATIGKRVKGFLFSYLPLPTLSKTAPPAPTRVAGPSRPRLPLPPLELLEKPRGPITTPVRPPLPKARAPKELVSLVPAPAPAKKTLPARRPLRRLVDLHHVAPPVEVDVVPRGPRPRTSSGGSVKDLVKNFEALDGARKGAAEVKRVRSVGDLNNKKNGAARPMWRP
ncbi:hypothetical protein DFH07DRAFT_1001928 [Mycena maculata]|uniref:Uncharacterized protein n=1 Tax=Mycena maculata TaxID=230809 RepID=A0AAD7MNV5_9AGAR|nr:hypothetical protein DFH07DRAFT_1001928 [Mycena maculata]